MKPLPTMHDVNHFVGLVAAAAVALDWDLVEAAFAGMNIEVASALAEQVSDFLARNAPPEVYAELAYHLPSVARFTVNSEFIKRFSAVDRGAPLPSTKSILSRLAFQLLRRGADATILVERMREANATVAFPLSVEALDDLLVWVVRRHLQDVRNASGAANAG